MTGTTVRVAIIGGGKMGTLLADLATETGSGMVLVAQLDRKATARGITRESLGGADVAIEFTVPVAAPRIVRECIAVHVPVVSGTTGWDEERGVVEGQVRSAGGTLLWAPNFSLGVHLFARVVAEAARLFAVPDARFDAHLVETHHQHKLDAPSGTARMLAARAEAARGKPLPVTSVRTGSVPGTHELVFDAPFEQVRLVHEARDRRAFAAGAIAAARWLAARKRPGVYTLDDFLGDLTK
jgi:4-hydroxy-tetrahydrodipicolinate reductase